MMSIYDIYRKIYIIYIYVSRKKICIYILYTYLPKIDPSLQTTSPTSLGSSTCLNGSSFHGWWAG